MYGNMNARLPTRIAGKRIIPFCDFAQSTKYDSGLKLILGKKYINPSDPSWKTSAGSIVTLNMVLGTTNVADAAFGDIYRETPGSGFPNLIATLPSTTNLIGALVSVDVSASFRPGAVDGIFVCRCWIATFNGDDQATCYGAWLEIS